MKFSKRQDIDAPVDAVFAAASDFARFERQARRRGAAVQRADQQQVIAPGLRWLVEFPYRKKQRRVRAELVGLSPTDLVELHAVSGGVEAGFKIEFFALSQKRTRMKVGLELRAKNLQARLLIQSLKLTKSRLDVRFADRVGRFAREVEISYDPSRALGPHV